MLRLLNATEMGVVLNEFFVLFFRDYTICCSVRNERFLHLINSALPLLKKQEPAAYLEQQGGSTLVKKLIRFRNP